MAYALGWSVVPQIELQRTRRVAGYRGKAIPLVYAGQEVQPDQPVLRLEPFDSSSSDEKQRSSSILPAGLSGQVTRVTREGGVVIKTRAAAVQGKIGAGQQTAGVLALWQPLAPGSDSPPAPIPAGAILVVPGPVDFAFLSQALNSGVVGVVASSISLRDLEGFLGIDLLSLLNDMDAEDAQTRLPPLTLLFTEGLGAQPMPERTLKLLSTYRGMIALLSGMTSVRHRLTPELLISLPIEEAQRNWHPTSPDPTLALGTWVRVCSGEYEGRTGQLERFFLHRQTFLSGATGRAVLIRCSDGKRLIVPWMNIERFS